jgi:hypothetical protein
VLRHELDHLQRAFRAREGSAAEYRFPQIIGVGGAGRRRPCVVLEQSIRDDRQLRRALNHGPYRLWTTLGGSLERHRVCRQPSRELTASATR